MEILGGISLGGTYDSDDEDVDGVPLGAPTRQAVCEPVLDDLDGEPLGSSAALDIRKKKKKESLLKGTMYEDSEDDEDLDGAPLVPSID